MYEIMNEKQKAESVEQLKYWKEEMKNLTKRRNAQTSLFQDIEEMPPIEYLNDCENLEEERNDIYGNIVYYEDMLRKWENKND